MDNFREGGLPGTMAYFASPGSALAGLEAAIDYYNAAETVDGRWAAFIGDPDGKIVAHSDPSMIGRDVSDIFGRTPFPPPGLDAEGEWVQTSLLRIYVAKYDGHIFGSGWSRGRVGPRVTRDTREVGMNHQGRTDPITSRLWRAASAFFTPLRLLPFLALALLLAVLAAPGAAQAADQLRFKSANGEWAVTYGVADDEIGRVIARGVPKGRIRYSIEGADGFSIHRRSGRVSYDGSPISGEHVSLTVTARDRKGEAASASRTIEVSVAQPQPASPPSGGENQSIPEPEPEPDTVAPTVSGIRTASTPAAHDSYGIGETITVGSDVQRAGVRDRRAVPADQDGVQRASGGVRIRLRHQHAVVHLHGGGGRPQQDRHRLLRLQCPQLAAELPGGRRRRDHSRRRRQRREPAPPVLLG